jgi:dihydrofolate reductase
MIVSIIAAVDENNGIGIGGRLPWKISSDLKRFKNLTMGHHLIMGRKTWDSIGRALQGRTNIILSRKRQQAPENTILKASLEEALEFAQQNNESEVFIIGGGQVYALALSFADRIYLSKIHATLPADVFFPILDWNAWAIREIRDIPASEKDQYAHTFMILERCDDRAIL